MKIFLLSLILMITGSSHGQKEPFEGIITYKVTTHVKDSANPYRFYYEMKYGDSLRIYIGKDGSYKKEFIGKGEHGFEWQIYLPKTNEYYAKYKGIDSVYYYDCGLYMSQLKSLTKGPSAKVMGNDCASLTVTTYVPEADETLVIGYYYSGEQLLPAHSYAQLKEGYVNDVYKQSKSHIVKYTLDLKHLFVTQEAVSIKPGIVINDLFKVPTDIPWVKWF